jgi:hypothetical protein
LDGQACAAAGAAVTTVVSTVVAPSSAATMAGRLAGARGARALVDIDDPWLLEGAQ